MTHAYQKINFGLSKYEWAVSECMCDICFRFVLIPANKRESGGKSLPCKIGMCRDKHMKYTCVCVHIFAPCSDISSTLDTFVLSHNRLDVAKLSDSAFLLTCVDVLLGVCRQY